MRNTRKKDYRIEELRILLAFMVSAIHICKHSGLLSEVKPGSIQYAITWLVFITSYCAVNTFGMISGYLAYDERKPEWKLKGYLVNWVHVVFYSFGWTVLFRLFGYDIGIKEMIRSLFPVANDAYWYFTAYTGMYFLAPLIKGGVQRLDQKKAMITFLISMLVPIYLFCASPFSDIFGLNTGFSALWLTDLYLVGCLIKKIGLPDKLPLPQNVLMMVLIAASLFPWVIQIIQIPSSHLELIKTYLVTYISPTVVWSAMILLCLFLMKKERSAYPAWIKFLGKASFGIYLCQEQVLFRKYVVGNTVAFAADYPPLQLLGVIASGVLFLIVLGIATELVWEFLFKVLRLRQLSAKIEYAVKKMSNQSYEFMEQKISAWANDNRKSS